MDCFLSPLISSLLSPQFVHGNKQQLININNLLFSYSYSVDLEHEEDLACEPCLNGDKKVKATDFCKTCEDPEPLCAYCAKQHTRQRAFKEHKLSGHIHQFPKHPSNKRYLH